MPRPSSALSPDDVAHTIHVIRGTHVMLDADLARLYGVPTRRLNEQVKRNRDRFPPDFMFRLTRDEFHDLKSQIATSSSAWGGRRALPNAFTEHGAVMLASVLKSPTAVHTSVLVVRAFIKLRRLLRAHAELARKLDVLESKYDAQFRVVFAAIRELMESPEDHPERKQIGFRSLGLPR